MITGTFVGDTPFIRVTVQGKDNSQSPYFILDTGFTGDLQITPQIASDLELKFDSEISARIADGSIIDVPVTYANAEMEGMVNGVEIFVSHSMLLAGISFLRKFGYTATIDCVRETVRLQSKPITNN